MASRIRRPRSASRYDLLANAWRLLTSAGVIAIAVVAWLQWRTLSTIEAMLDASQRPWIAASVEPVQLAFDDKGGGITLKMTVKNTGALPAVDVMATPVLLLDAKQPYKQACGQYGIGGGVGPELSSNEVFPKTSTAWLARGDFGKKFPGLLAVCIEYRFAGSRRTGQAGYLFSIGRRDPAHPEPTVIEPNNGTLIPPELVLLPTASYHD